MNKKLFMSATAVTVVTVAGLVYYRHQVLRQLDKWLHPEVQGPGYEERLAEWEESLLKEEGTVETDG